MPDTPNLIRATSNLPGILVAGALASSTTAVYTGPANKSTAIGTASVCNKSGVDRTAYLFVNKAGGGTAQVGQIDLEPGESCIAEELVGLFLGPGDSISGYASAAAAVDIAISGAVSS